MNFIFKERNGLIDFYVDETVFGLDNYIEFDPHAPSNVSFTILPENLNTIIDILNKDTNHNKAKGSLYIYRGQQVSSI